MKRPTLMTHPMRSPRLLAVGVVNLLKVYHLADDPHAVKPDYRKLDSQFMKVCI